VAVRWPARAKGAVGASNHQLTMPSSDAVKLATPPMSPPSLPVSSPESRALTPPPKCNTCFPPRHAHRIAVTACRRGGRFTFPATTDADRWIVPHKGHYILFYM
jgi:hypothetical protein